MKFYFLIILLFFISFLSCNRNYEKTSFYETGELKERFLYTSKGDYNSNANYIGYSYYKNGNIKNYTVVHNYEREGDYLTYYENQYLKSAIRFKEGKKHGICQYFSDEGELVEENVYINDSLLIKMKSYNSGKENINFYYYIEEDTVEENGILVFNENGTINPEKSFYYYVTSPSDTLNQGELYNFEINVFTFNERSSIKEFLLGDFDCQYSFIDTSNLVRLESSNNKLQYSVKPKNKGYNFIMGKFYVEDTAVENGKEIPLSREFIFYDDFIVLPR